MVGDSQTTPKHHYVFLVCAIVGVVLSAMALPFTVYCGYVAYRSMHPSSLHAAEPVAMPKATIYDYSLAFVLACCAALCLIVLIVGINWLHRKWQLRREKIGRKTFYDVVGDCSMGEDRLGPWKYGYSHGIGNGFSPFKARQSDWATGVDRWFCPEMPNALGVMHNRTDSTVAGDTNSYRIRADMLHMHPGEGGYCAVIRWQCPEDGIYTIEGSCEGLDNQKDAEAEVCIMRNSVKLWQAKLVGGDPSAKAFSRPKEYFESGNTLDFVVSQGVWFGGDSVGLKATIRKG